MKKTRQRAQRKHNPIAKALRLPMLRQRVEHDRKRAEKRGYRKHAEQV